MVGKSSRRIGVSSHVTGLVGGDYFMLLAAFCGTRRYEAGFLLVFGKRSAGSRTMRTASFCGRIRAMEHHGSRADRSPRHKQKMHDG